MTEITKEIFEKHEIRKTEKQKTAFIQFVTEKAEKMGYDVKIEKGMFGARNIIVGDIDNAKVIYTAHYDTCAALPFPNFIAPKCFLLYLLYQIAIVLGFFAVAFVLGFVCGFIGSYIGIPESYISSIAAIVYWLLLLLMFCGPANKHTANDNTSGVTVLFDIMAELNDSNRQNAAFVFFDLEESGLFGSASFASKHKKIKKEKLVVNFDCVSDGDDVLIILPKKLQQNAEKFETAFQSTDKINCEIIKKSIFYPSDQKNFKLGVGVAAFKKTKRGMLYLNRIHTKKDTVYEEKNIEFLKNGAVKLIELL